DEQQPRYEAERLRYDEGRPPDRRLDQGFDRPPMRGGPGEQFRQSGPQQRAWPDPRERRPDAAPPRSGPATTASEGYRRFWSEGNDRQSRTTMSPPPGRRDGPPPRVTERGPPPPAASGNGRINISVAEFRDLQDRVRELER